ncbi:MAG: Gfo/Idh/MocA family oxidoreductase [Chloroflexia bacterium]
MAESLNWGILGAGSIARTFAKGVAKSSTGTLTAVGSRSQEGADKFGEEFNVARRHASYDDLLADPDVQAVYIAVPHPMHAVWAPKAADAVKHILCEKPLALNRAEASAVVEAAIRNDVFLMEAFMYRCHPQTARLVELIREGAIGEVRLIQATFSFQTGTDPESRLMNPELGGGGILDVGCYCASNAARREAAVGKDFENPVELKAVAKMNDATGVDEYTVASLRFPAAPRGSRPVCRSAGERRARLRQRGASLSWGRGYPGARGAVGAAAQARSVEPEKITTETRSSCTGSRPTRSRSIERRHAASPAPTWDDTLGNMLTLDMWRQEIGLVPFQWPGRRRRR